VKGAGVDSGDGGGSEPVGSGKLDRAVKEAGEWALRCQVLQGSQQGSGILYLLDKSNSLTYDHRSENTGLFLCSIIHMPFIDRVS
jgi:hypothetical protein